MNLYLGLDFGTSGARYALIDSQATLRAEGKYVWPEEAIAGWPSVWQAALFALIEDIPGEMRREIRAIAIDGTSATVLLSDAEGKPICEPLFYNDGRGVETLKKVRAIAPPQHPVLSATSSLAKLFWLLENCLSINENQTNYFLHQADWLGFLLHGQLGISDYHNALKLGYDVGELCYPEWLTKGLNCSSEAEFSYPRLNLRNGTGETIAQQLPQVVAPGTAVGRITSEIADNFGLPADCVVRAGTTDSIAAFIASGAISPGEAVTSLGSTLVLKLLSRDRIDDARYGIYSHRFLALGFGNCSQAHLAGPSDFGDLWLTGGASNVGGAVLREFFTDAELESLSREIDPDKESLLDYYPLLKRGDRFPINDPELPPRLEPKPDNPLEFLHGLLESIARIEARGYELLQELGATPLTRVYSAGGGSKNPTWTAIRRRHLKVPVEKSIHTEAAYGAAILAMGSRFRI